jgi:heme oxygenase
VATIQGEKIHLSDIYQVFDETTFNTLAPAKKTAFVRKYAVVKYITSHEQQDLTGINFNIAEEKNKLKHDLIIQEIEKYVIDNLHFSDSTLKFVGDALNVDVFVKTLTVAHKFSFGQGNERTKEEAYNRAKTIYNRIFSGELTYEEALSIYGESPVSKIKGNEMGQIYFGLMPKNFNNAVWSSTEGKLLEPLESSMGFHVIIVDRKIPKFGKDKKEFDRDELKKELEKGKYGYQEESFSIFVDTLYQKYIVLLNQVELYNVWDFVQEIEGVRSMSGIPVNKLREVDYNNVIGRIGGKEITLDWIVNEANNFSFYKNVSINSGFSFNKFISDVIARHLLVQWYEDNKILFSGFEKTIRQKSVNKIYKHFLNKTLEHNPDLTKDIIINRFMLENGIVINSGLFTEDTN